MNIATAKDLDFLLATLKGDKSDLLLQAVEEALDDDAKEGDPVEEAKQEEQPFAMEESKDSQAESTTDIAAVSMSETSQINNTTAATSMTASSFI